MSSRAKFSTTSELLREDTFEAERLMELHTICDYKERQIARLRQEERTIQQIILDQKDIISYFGASLGVSSESFNDSLPTIELEKVGSELQKSKSGTFSREDLEDRPKIYNSGSASNLLEEMSDVLSKQTFHENTSAPGSSKGNHSFFQSRQNFFQAPPTAQITADLEQATDFNAFFRQYPIAILFAFGFFEGNFPTQQWLSLIESWPASKNSLFFTAFFQSMRQSSKFMGMMIELLKVPNIYQLTGLVENSVPNYFEAKRCCYLTYEPATDDLVFLKEKIKIRFQVKAGLFQRALSTQNPIEANADDPDVTQADKVIFQQSKQVFCVPVLSIRSQFQVDGLLLIFDKFGGIQQTDYLTASILARCISYIIPKITALDERKNRQAAFQKAIDTYVTLCSASNLGSLVDSLSQNLGTFFRCEAVRVFKVQTKKQVFRELTKFETLGEPHPFGTGIVGSCISNVIYANLTKPQFHENYNPEVDCYDSNSFSSSLLVSPIVDETKASKWVIVLYNKQELHSFSELDEELLKLLCKHMLPLLKNAWRSKKLAQTIKRSKVNLDQANALTDVISSLKSPTDLSSMLTRMTRFFRDNTNFTILTLYEVDRFRQELVNVEKMETISLSSTDLIAECARTGRIIEHINPLDNSRVIYWAVFDSSTSVIGVFKMSGADSITSLDNSTVSVPPPPQKRPKVREQASSLSLLNTFRESLSNSKLNFVPSCDSHSFNEKLDDSQDLRKMIRMWQRVAGSVLEGAKKHQYYTKRKLLIDNMNVALYDNQFDESFKVWQELQLLIDSFEPLDSSKLNIESPEISDIVYANTSELSDKTIQLVRTLQSLHPIDSTVFSTEATSRMTLADELTVLDEDESSMCPFLSTTGIDLTSLDDGAIIDSIVSACQQLAVLQFLKVTESEMEDFLTQLRAIHPNKTFHSWRLAVDHFQFAAFLMLNTNFGRNLSDLEMISVLFYLLTLYSAPQDIEKPSVESITKFTLETSGQFSTLSSFFACCAWGNNQILENLKMEYRAEIMHTIDELDASSQAESFIGAPPVMLITCVAKYSYMMRENTVTAKWVDLKMKEDIPDDFAEDADEIKKYELQYERDSFALPMMEEAIKIDPDMQSLTERMQVNYSAVIGEEC